MGDAPHPRRHGDPRHAGAGRLHGQRAGLRARPCAPWSPPPAWNRNPSTR